MDYTKTAVRSDWAYARHLMRQADPLLTEDNFEELSEIALELSASATTLMAYLRERGVLL
jgi:hypothetical protein